MKLQQFESLIKEVTGFPFCVLFGSASKALSYCVSQSAKSIVDFPSNICPDVVRAITCSGKIPREVPFSSVSNCVLNHSCDSMALTVDNFGIPMESQATLNDSVHDACLSYGVFEGPKLVERVPNRYRCIISFGFDKAINLGGGGALLTIDREVASSAREYLERKRSNSEFARIVDAAKLKKTSLEHTQIYNAMFLREQDASSRLLSWEKDYLGIFSELPEFFDPGLIANYRETPAELERRWRRESDNFLFARDKIARDLRGVVELQSLPYGSRPWRLSLFVVNRNRILENLLRKNLSVSSWHPMSSLFFSNLRAASEGRWKISQHIQNSILNLREDCINNPKKIQLIISELKNHAKA